MDDVVPQSGGEGSAPTSEDGIQAEQAVVGSLSEQPAPRRRSRGLIPSILVLLVVAAVTLGGFAVSAALSEKTQGPQAVGNDVIMRPLSGWTITKTGAVEPGLHSLTLTRGDGNLQILAAPFRGTPVQLLTLYVERYLRGQASQLSVSSQVTGVSLSSGLVGVRASYVGTIPDRAAGVIEGEVTAVVSPSGIGVIFDGWSPRGLYQYAHTEVDSMIDGTRVS